MSSEGWDVVSPQPERTVLERTEVAQDAFDRAISTITGDPQAAAFARGPHSPDCEFGAVPEYRAAPILDLPPATGNPKDAIGDTKPQIHLVPPGALVYTAKVMELGARKYGPYNWRQQPVRRTVYLSALLRHALRALDGEDVDPESGMPHEAHIVACAAIILDAMATGNLLDDRPTPGVAGRLIEDLTERAA